MMIHAYDDGPSLAYDKHDWPSMKAKVQAVPLPDIVVS